MNQFLKTLFFAVLLSFVWVGATVAKPDKLPEKADMAQFYFVAPAPFLPALTTFDAIAFDVGHCSFDVIYSLEAKETTKAKKSELPFVPIADEVLCRQSPKAVFLIKNMRISQTPQNSCKQYKSYFVETRT